MSELRYDIAILIREKHKPQNKWSVPSDIIAQQILKLISESVQKIENPFDASPNDYESFESCRQQVLESLK